MQPKESFKLDGRKSHDLKNRELNKKCHFTTTFYQYGKIVIMVTYNEESWEKWLLTKNEHTKTLETNYVRF